MPECATCGAHVTADYHRVFADNDGVVHGCPVCRPRGDRHATEGGA